MFFSKNKFFRKKISFRTFFSPNFIYLGPRWKQEANRCHRCIRDKLWKWVGTDEIFQLNNMSKIWQKHGFLTLANPTLETFFGRVYRGPLVQM